MTRRALVQRVIDLLRSLGPLSTRELRERTRAARSSLHVALTELQARRRIVTDESCSPHVHRAILDRGAR